jgi:hypothetical protein
MEILADNNEDSEIRIAAYLGVMKCSDYKTVLAIKDLLNREEVNQGFNLQKKTSRQYF